MSDVFVSYKREDEDRVGRLVEAMKAEGLAVWWDRAVPGGEGWRLQIAQALEESKCTVVVWTRASAGPDGHFVWDEASRARANNQLVPVTLDKVMPPLGFGEIQCIDLTHWRGRRSDPFFQDLVAAIRAKLAGQPVPAHRGPMWRLRRRLAAGGLAAAASTLLAAFASNTLALQDRLCTVKIAQPALADACGALGLGSRPTRAERIAWSERAAGSCDALRQHLGRFATGAHRDEAQALLAARKVSLQEVWTDAVQPQALRLFVDTRADPAASDDLARIAAHERGLKKAERLCRDFDAAGLTRFLSVDVEPQEWTCERTGGGVICGFDGKALCRQQVVQRVERELCQAGPQPPG